MVNKKGWLLVIEVVIAVLIMFSFLFISMSRQPGSTSIDTSSVLDYVVEEATTTERGSLLTNVEDLNSKLKEKINHTRFDVSIRKCDPKCSPPNLEKEIGSSTFFVWESGNTQKFIAYVWLRD
ncbi:MAG: hypothetical protein JSW08_00850 [archaeon]|nr:MAG: hypothetical protein JSW08_00850 [archaeon]